MSALEFADATEFESSEWESEAESEAAEARRRRTPARPTRYAQPPPARGYVTQAQFQQALDKVRADVGQNATAIRAVGTQVDALSKRSRTELKTLRDEVTRTRDETRNTLQTLAILPLLASGGTTKLSVGTGAGAQTVDDSSGQPAVVATPPDSLTQLLPLLLLSGSFGGFSGTGSPTGGGGDSGLMLAVALIAASGRK